MSVKIFTNPCQFNCKEYELKETTFGKSLFFSKDILSPIDIIEIIKVSYENTNGENIEILSNRVIKDFGNYTASFIKTLQYNNKYVRQSRYVKSYISISKNPTIERYMKNEQKELINSHAKLFNNKYHTDINKDLVCECCFNTIFTLEEWCTLNEIFRLNFEAVSKYLDKLGFTKRFGN